MFGIMLLGFELVIHKALVDKPHHLLWDLYFLILPLLARKLLSSWYVIGVFRCQGHTNPVTGQASVGLVSQINFCLYFVQIWYFASDLTKNYARLPLDAWEYM